MAEISGHGRCNWPRRGLMRPASQRLEISAVSHETAEAAGSTATMMLVMV